MSEDSLVKQILDFLKENEAPAHLGDEVLADIVNLCWEKRFELVRDDFNSEVEEKITIAINNHLLLQEEKDK